MGLQIINKDIDIENTARAYGGGVRRGLEVRHFLNYSVEKAARNYAPGKPDATIFGEPTLGGGGSYLQCKSLSHFLQSQWQEPFGGTVIIVARTLDTAADNATRPCLFGTASSLPLLSDGTAISGFSLLRLSAANTVAFNATRGDESANASHTALISWTPSNWTAFVCTAPAGVGQNTILNATSGTTVVSSTPAAAARYPSRAAMRWGSGYSALAGTNEIMMVFGWSVVLSSDEIATELALARAYALRKYGYTF